MLRASLTGSSCYPVAESLAVLTGPYEPYKQTEQRFLMDQQVRDMEHGMSLFKLEGAG